MSKIKPLDIFLIAATVSMGLLYQYVDMVTRQPILFGIIFSHHIAEISMFAVVGFVYARRYRLGIRETKKINSKTMFKLMNVSVLALAPLLAYTALTLRPHGVSDLSIDLILTTIIMGSIVLVYVPYFSSQLVAFLLTKKVSMFGVNPDIPKFTRDEDDFR